MEKEEKDRREAGEQDGEEEDETPLPNPGQLSFAQFENFMSTDLNLTPKDIKTIWADIAQGSLDDAAREAPVSISKIDIKMQMRFDQLTRRDIRAEVLQVLSQILTSDAILKDP